MILFEADLITNLRILAEEDALKGEYHKEEHVAWLAANRIEELQAMIDGKGDPRLLHEIATRLWHKEQYERIMAHPTTLETHNQKANTKIQSSGTG